MCDRLGIEGGAAEVKLDVLRQVKKLVVENKTDLQWFWNREGVDRRWPVLVSLLDKDSFFCLLWEKVWTDRPFAVPQECQAMLNV